MPTKLEEVTKEMILKQVDETIKQHEDPLLVSAVLFHLYDANQHRASLPKRLGISNESVSNILDFLKDNDLVRLDDRYMKSYDEEFTESDSVRILFNEPTSIYLKSGTKLAIGPHHVIEDTLLNKEKALAVMKAIDPLIESWYYSRTDEIPLEHLQGLKRTTYLKIKDIREGEISFIRNLLKLKENEKTEGVTFVHEADPTKSEGYHNKIVDVRIDLTYDSPEQAIEGGFTEAKAYPKSDVPINPRFGNEEPLNYFVPGLSIRKVPDHRATPEKPYEFSFTNLTAVVIGDQSYATIKEAVYKQNSLESVIKKILP